MHDYVGVFLFFILHLLKVIGVTLFSLGGGGAHCARADFNEL